MLKKQPPKTTLSNLTEEQPDLPEGLHISICCPAPTQKEGREDRGGFPGFHCLIDSTNPGPLSQVPTVSKINTTGLVSFLCHGRVASD